MNSAPPWMHGGNMDNKELVAGTTLFIPVHAKGALFEAGDGHAGQGNGEVDITALETFSPAPSTSSFTRIATCCGRAPKRPPLHQHGLQSRSEKKQPRLPCAT